MQKAHGKQTSQFMCKNLFLGQLFALGCIWITKVYVLQDIYLSGSKPAHITLELQGMPFRKYIFLLGTNILSKKMAENFSITFTEIQFWNRHVASHYYLDSMCLRPKLLKSWFFLNLNVNANIKCPGIEVFLKGFWECAFLYCVYVCTLKTANILNWQTFMITFLNITLLDSCYLK